MKFNRENKSQPNGIREKRPSKAAPLTCLHCFYPFRVQGAAENCPACGERNLHVDQTTYWNQDPVVRKLEGAAKALVVIVLAAVTYILFTTPGGFGMGQGWAIAFPVVLGWILWDAIGLLTRRSSMLNHRVLWPWLCACVGIAPALFFLFALVLMQEYDSYETIAGSLAWAAIWAIPAYGFHLLASRLSSLRERRMLSRVVAAGQGSTN
ncbi:MAG: hypothetical protein GY930_12660 [bacterium]|nr:hypothetical protein [bacterium]